MRAFDDEVADTYVDLAVGRLDDEPWLRAALDAFAEDVAVLATSWTLAAGRGTSPPTSPRGNSTCER